MLEITRPLLRLQLLGLQNINIKKRRGKVNSKKVHAVIASAKADWHPDTWDGDIWEDTDDDQEDWDELEEEAKWEMRENLRLVHVLLCTGGKRGIWLQAM